MPIDLNISKFSFSINGRCSTRSRFVHHTCFSVILIGHFQKRQNCAYCLASLLLCSTRFQNKKTRLLQFVGSIAYLNVFFLIKKYGITPQKSQLDSWNGVNDSHSVKHTHFLVKTSIQVIPYLPQLQNWIYAVLLICKRKTTIDISYLDNENGQFHCSASYCNSLRQEREQLNAVI